MEIKSYTKMTKYPFISFVYWYITPFFFDGLRGEVGGQQFRLPVRIVINAFALYKGKMLLLNHCYGVTLKSLKSIDNLSIPSLSQHTHRQKIFFYYSNVGDKEKAQICDLFFYYKTLEYVYTNWLKIPLYTTHSLQKSWSKRAWVNLTRGRFPWHSRPRGSALTSSYTRMQAILLSLFR